jgi:hypothetical protein
MVLVDEVLGGLRSWFVSKLKLVSGTLDGWGAEWVAPGALNP